MMDNLPLLSATEVAQMLHVHRNTIKRIPPENLPYFKVNERGDRRYETSDVIKYLRERLVNASR